jgi:hypothetical protein
MAKSYKFQCNVFKEDSLLVKNNPKGVEFLVTETSSVVLSPASVDQLIKALGELKYEQG